MSIEELPTWSECLINPFQNGWMAIRQGAIRYGDKLAALSDMLTTFTSECLARSAQIAGERTKLIVKLNQALCSRNSRLFPVGSSVTRLSCDPKPDIDLTFMVAKETFWSQFHGNADYRRFFMDSMCDMIAECDFIRLAKPIVPLYYTSVPLLICEVEEGYNLDIQFPTTNYQSVRNTHLVRQYALADVRFPQLYFYVRSLFHALGLRNSRERLLSSFQIACLVIHFLQRTDSPTAPVLPALCTMYSERFGAGVPVKRIIKENELPDDRLPPLDWKSENTQSVGELVIDFFGYYVNDFNPDSMAIRLSDGRIGLKRHHKDPRGGRLTIYDPYSNNTVCRSNLIVSIFNPVFRYIWEGITERGEFLESFPNFVGETEAFRKHFEHDIWGKVFQLNGRAENDNDGECDEFEENG